MTDSSTPTILFDLDGTLVDTIELIIESYRHTVRTHGLDPVPEEEWIQSLGIPLRIQFRRFTDDPEAVQAMVATYLDHNHRLHDDLVREYPGVREAVERLHRSGCRLGVVSSKMHGGLELGLTSGGYDGLFEIVIGADDVENPKPHPEPVLRAMEALDADPRNTVFVGDSPHDMASGRSAGVRTAAVLWGPFRREVLEPHAPDYWLEEPADILTLLEF